jgi:uncharacterized membrane protein YkoI
MTLSRPQKFLFTAAAAVGLAAGGVGIASAATTPSTAAPALATAESPSYTGSVTVPDNGQDTGTGNETAESSQLQGLAKITPDQARQAALGAVPGTASTPVLEDENGNVVYGVEIQTASGTVDVKVDAGNGTVLSQDTGGDSEKQSTNETDSGPEAPDASEQGSTTTN